MSLRMLGGALVALTLIACVPGGSGGGGGGGGDGGVNGMIPGGNDPPAVPPGGEFESGLPDDNAPLSGLSDEEVQQLCDRLGPQVDALLGGEERSRLTCLGLALTLAIFGGGVNACEMAYRDCLADPAGFMEENGFEAEITDEEETCDIEKFRMRASMCDAPVGTLEDCVTEQVAVLRDLIDDFACAIALSNPDLGNPMLGPACTALEMQCPGILDDDDEDEFEFGPDAGPPGE
ncbi:MAG: hypothetical protein KC620_02900 [Myxococcales bacterium]|nr:hypothetical protein [Myxococcales bacterium]